MDQTFIFPLYSLLDIHIKTLISVLFWGNLVAATLVYSFIALTPRSGHGKHSYTYFTGKLFQALAYLLLFFRDQIPDLLSVNCGNTFLFIGFWLEARSALQAIHADSPTVRKLCIGITAACVILFNAAEVIRPGDPAFRVFIASICVFLTLCVPTERLLLFPGTSPFKRAVGVFYLVFLAMLLPRAVAAMLSPFGLHSNTLVQALTFLSMVLLLVFSLAAYLFLLKEESDKALSEMAAMDTLTGLPNRRTFFATAQIVFAGHVGGNTPLAVLHFELDDFKNVNAIWGHSFGDFFLKSFAAALKHALRGSDTPCRYGNGEFLAILPGADAEQAAAIGKQALVGLKKIFLERRTGFIFTVSGGVSSGVPAPGDTLADYLRQANQALHIAQTTGNNKIVLWKK